jgi:ABC-type glycerol-3-phosphate transport system substrate-binding protein
MKNLLFVAFIALGLGLVACGEKNTEASADSVAVDTIAADSVASDSVAVDSVAK